MTVKRLLIVAPIALLAACGDGAADEDASASAEVLEGTISDGMLPIDRVRSEPPLEDPEAFEAAQSKGAPTPGGAAPQSEPEGEGPLEEAGEPEEAPPAAEPAIEAE